MNLRSLSDTQLLNRTESLAGRERRATLNVVLHLVEIERRNLHLRRGYSSLFAFCTSALGYSSSGAFRRITAARCVARFPDIAGMLAANAVNISTIVQVSPVLTAGNKDELLRGIRGRSQREVASIVAEYSPESERRERVRTVVMRVPAAQGDGGVPALELRPASASTDSACTSPAVDPARAEAPGQQQPRVDHCRNGSDAAAVGIAPAKAHCRNGSKETGAALDSPRRSGPVEKRVFIQFSARPGFMEAVERVRVLAWHRLPANASLEQAFEMVLHYFLEREEPATRRARRARRAKGAKRQPESSGAQAPAGGKRVRRSIPAARRDEVHARDGGRCSYVGEDGRRCDATRGLQVDHVTPVALGGGNEAGNLRLLCANHNQLEARRLLGPARVIAARPNR